MSKTLIAGSCKATTQRSLFSRTTSVSIDIDADPSVIWALLTNTSDYPRWNTTVVSIDGKIALGEKINLRSTLDPKRTYKLKIKEWEPNKKLVWGDAMGQRVFTLSNGQPGNVTFTMTEKIGGPLFPLFAKMIPPFNASFEQFATSLKQEAETIMSAR